MSYIIDSVKVLKVGATAVTEKAACRSFIIQNNGEAAIYFREKTVDGAAASAGNGFVLLPGETARQVLSANELSIIAAAANTDVRILYVTEGL